jgi:hypothetical protein
MACHAESKAPVPNPAVACRPADDGWMVLVNLDTGRSLALNPTAAAVWRLVDGRRTPADIVAALAATFTDVPDHAAGDVEGVLASLFDCGIVGYRVMVRDGGSAGAASQPAGTARGEGAPHDR